ncbi:MAG: cation:proton antiporter [Thermoleophilaceae bacterium]
MLLIFLPPLLYAAAFFANLRELRANVRPIGMLAVGLVIVTTVVVAAVAHAVIGLGAMWEILQFLLNALSAVARAGSVSRARSSRAGRAAGCR